MIFCLVLRYLAYLCLFSSFPFPSLRMTLWQTFFHWDHEFLSRSRWTNWKPRCMSWVRPQVFFFLYNWQDHNTCQLFEIDRWKVNEIELHYNNFTREDLTNKFRDSYLFVKLFNLLWYCKSNSVSHMVTRTFPPLFSLQSFFLLLHFLFVLAVGEQ